jgi:putative flavoprotein involved in K+ transport
VDAAHDVVVIGGGQAGLSVGYYLRAAGADFVILDAADRVGATWHRRWDSLELFTVGRYSSLPGLDFPGDPEHFPGKDEVADYLDAYATALDLPVRLNTRATSLARADDGYQLDTNAGSYRARQVIVATGAYERPFVPDVATKLDPGVAQLHSVEYTNPDQIKPGEVLVVGGANSGVQIAQDLSRTHPVRLAVGTKPPRMPRRILGKSLHWWGDHLGLMRAPIARFRTPKRSGDLLIGTSYAQLARRHGVELHGRVVDADGGTVTCADGITVEPSSVVWATGFRSDYSWIDVPVFDEHGMPVHKRGVTEAAGLYFLGMHLQYSLGSSLIGFVRHDAKFLVDASRVDRTDPRYRRAVTLRRQPR